MNFLPEFAVEKRNLVLANRKTRTDQVILNIL